MWITTKHIWPERVLKKLPKPWKDAEALFYLQEINRKVKQWRVTHAFWHSIYCAHTTVCSLVSVHYRAEIWRTGRRLGNLPSSLWQSLRRRVTSVCTNASRHAFLLSICSQYTLNSVVTDGENTQAHKHTRTHCQTQAGEAQKRPLCFWLESQ